MKFLEKINSMFETIGGLFIRDKKKDAGEAPPKEEVSLDDLKVIDAPLVKSEACDKCAYDKGDGCVMVSDCPETKKVLSRFAKPSDCDEDEETDKHDDKLDEKAEEEIDKFVKRFFDTDSECEKFKMVDGFISLMARIIDDEKERDTHFAFEVKGDKGGRMSDDSGITFSFEDSEDDDDSRDDGRAGAVVLKVTKKRGETGEATDIGVYAPISSAYSGGRASRFFTLADAISSDCSREKSFREEYYCFDKLKDDDDEPEEAEVKAERVVLPEHDIMSFVMEHTMMAKLTRLSIEKKVCAKCSSCQKEAPKDALVCSFCGHKVVPEHYETTECLQPQWYCNFLTYPNPDGGLNGICYENIHSMHIETSRGDEDDGMVKEAYDVFLLHSIKKGK